MNYMGLPVQTFVKDILGTQPWHLSILGERADDERAPCWILTSSLQMRCFSQLSYRGPKAIELVVGNANLFSCRQLFLLIHYRPVQDCCQSCLINSLSKKLDLGIVEMSLSLA